ncbi:hypothetical protein [Dyadobacter psychrotolerans]|uniref:Uncharacterized protein n=1 Tax=Dyadobacter psychrotolerans TaxID=2541721 RepID=A0A4R5DC39_9BACT|nr:hypothetical protein [Dyadobacter psychrotolerans]TDE11282.1 hypothetical protein E0F88_25555 [Dyadobacter psychrotolerans]
MLLEKIFKLAENREAKIVIRGQHLRNSNTIDIDFEFLIKDSNETNYRPPIGLNHPQFWKLKKSTQEKSQLLQLEYSGVSRRQVRAAIDEFEQVFGQGCTVMHHFGIENRIKHLKGIRVSAWRKRLLAGV